LINQTNGNIWITSGNLNILLGGLQIGGTNVIDSSRNVIAGSWVNGTNAYFTGTIYGNIQGSITSTGNLNMNNYDIYNVKNVNTTNLFATGNVGIGTTTPSEKLEVSGNIKLSGYINIAGSYIRKVGSSIVISDV
jgi:hypothetical protein